MRGFYGNVPEQRPYPGAGQLSAKRVWLRLYISLQLQYPGFMIFALRDTRKIGCVEEFQQLSTRCIVELDCRKRCQTPNALHGIVGTTAPALQAILAVSDR